MFTFYEWLGKKKGVTSEALGRLAQMTHEELPDTVPQPGQVVIFMDRPKVAITNNDIYYVLHKDDNAVTLVPKAAIDQGNPNIGHQMQIPRAMWTGFALINHLLTRKEKIERFANKPVWIVGASKDKWIANREAEMRKQSRQKMQNPGVHEPTEIDPIKLAQVKQQFTGGGKEEEPEVSAARNWLRGG